MCKNIYNDKLTVASIYFLHKMTDYLWNDGFITPWLLCESAMKIEIYVNYNLYT